MIDISQSDAVMEITLNRPERRNALGTESVAALRDALTGAEADRNVRAVVLAAAPPAFCAGSDLKELGGLSVDQMVVHEAETAAVARSIGRLSKPVVAAVEGYALGGGFVLAVSCDIVVSSRSVRWHLPEVPNGWIPPWGLHTLAARVGPVRARILTWAAEPIDGVEAHRLGVADVLVEDGAARDAAHAVARRHAALPAPAVASTKQFFEAWMASDGERQDALAGRMFAADCAHETARATLAKFGGSR